MKILEFTTPGCPVCNMMEKSVLSKIDIEGLEIVKIMANEQPELAKKFEVLNAPTFIKLNKEGKEMSRASGYMSVNKFKNTFNL